MPSPISVSLIETETDWVLTDFSHPNISPSGAQAKRGVLATSPRWTFDVKDAFRKMRRFMMNVKGIREDEAIALRCGLRSIRAGFTQVVRRQLRGAMRS